MIPAKIHLFWMGQEMPDIYKLLLFRWRALHPDWNVKLWGFDETLSLIIRMKTGLADRFMQKDLTYSTKSDLARYHIVAHEGGIYLDTDFVALRPLDPLRDCDLFGVVEEPPDRICSGVFGAIPGHPVFQDVFQELQGRDYHLTPEWLAGPGMFNPIMHRHLDGNPRGRILGLDTFLPIRYHQRDDTMAWCLVDLHSAFAAHLWAHSWNPRGCTPDQTLLWRAGAILLNPKQAVWMNSPLKP